MNVWFLARMNLRWNRRRRRDGEGNRKDRNEQDDAIRCGFKMYFGFALAVGIPNIIIVMPH